MDARYSELPTDMHQELDRYLFNEINHEILTWDEVYFYDDDTVIERANKLGITRYDTDLPMDWCKDFYAVTKLWPYGQMVWSYAFSSNFGYPAPLTEECHKVLCDYRRVRPHGYA